MTFDEALALLGLTPPTDAGVARRAYAKLLKTHRPESDPEGFMRLREAYERVRDALAGEAPVEAPPPAETAPAMPEAAPPPAPPSPWDADDEADLDAYTTLGDFEAAARLLGSAFYLARRRGVFEGLPVDAVLALALRAHERGRPAPARAALAALSAWLDDGQLEARLVQDERALRLAMCRELGALPDDLPRSLRAALAGAARDGEPDDAAPAFVRALGEGTRPAKRMADLLAEKAPILGVPVVEALRREPPARWNLGCILPPFVGIVGALIYVNLTGPAPRPDPRGRYSIDSDDGDVPLAVARFELTSAILASGAPLEARERSIDAAIKAGDCTRAEVAVEDLWSGVDRWEGAGRRSANLGRAARRMERAVHAWCKQGAPAGEGPPQGR
jgi:hypothetical protein